MKSRNAAAALAALGIAAGGTTLAALPALAAANHPAVVGTTPDTTPDTTAGSTAGTGTDGTSATSDTTATGGTATASDEAGHPVLDTWIADALQPLIDDGTITQEQADAITAALEAAAPVRGGRVGVSLDVLTSALGVTAQELRTAFADGQSIADVAAAQGVDVQTVIDALVAAATERIDAAVADGTLTSAQGAARTATLTARVTELVTHAGGPGGGRHDGGERPHGPMGPGGPIGHDDGHMGPGQMGPGNGDGTAGQPAGSAPSTATTEPGSADTTPTTVGA